MRSASFADFTQSICVGGAAESGEVAGEGRVYINTLFTFCLPDDNSDLDTRTT